MRYGRLAVIVASLIIVGVALGAAATWWRSRSAVMPQPSQPVAGNDADVHGCIGSAGYRWCEAKAKCLRVWEEPCTTEDALRNYLKDRLGELSPEPEVLGGTFYVTELSLLGDGRADVAYEDGHNAWRAIFQYRLNGDEVVIEDFRLADAAATPDAKTR